MDPSVVSKAVAQRYAFMLSEQATQDEKEAQGRRFLEKIVQLPIQLPPVEDFSGYLGHLGKKLEGKKAARKDKVTFGWEALGALPWWLKVPYLPLALYVDGFMWWLARKAVLDAEVASYAIQDRLFHGLPLTEQQEEGVSRLGPEDSIIINAVRAGGRSAWRNMPGMFKALREVQAITRKRLAEQLEIVDADIEALTPFAPHLRGNPRSIKRFVNGYRLAKSIIQGANPDSAVPLDQLAAWMVLMQSWSIHGSRFYETCRILRGLPGSDPRDTGSLPDSLADYVRRHHKKLADLCADERAFEVLGCFSFLPLAPRDRVPASALGPDARKVAAG
jgi:hypothetical protein